MANDVVVIIGGTRGLGQALAQAAHNAENKVAVCGRSAESQTDPTWLSRPCDVLDAAAVGEFLQAVNAWQPQIDVLIITAGIISDHRFTNMTNAAWQQVLNVNLVSVYHTVQPVFTQMLAQHAGRIYLFTSTAGMFGVFGQANYAAAKAGLIALAQTLAQEGRAQNVCAYAIAPAAVTDMTRPALTQAKAKADARHQPLPAYWHIGSAAAFAETFWQLDKTHPASGQVFGINGANITVYPQRQGVPYSLG